MEENNSLDHPLVGRDDSNVVVVLPAASNSAAPGNGTGGAIVCFQQSTNAPPRASPVVVENIKNGIIYK